MTFEQALKAMREGKKVFRVGWTKNKDIEKIICSKSNLFILNCDDIFAEDWEICLEIPKQDETVREMVKRSLEEHQVTINNAMKEARIEFLGEDFDKPYEKWVEEHKAQDNEHLRADKIVLEHSVKALEKEISEKTAENNELRGQIKAYKDILQTFYGGD